MNSNFKTLIERLGEKIECAETTGSYINDGYIESKSRNKKRP